MLKAVPPSTDLSDTVTCMAPGRFKLSVLSARPLPSYTRLNRLQNSPTIWSSTRYSTGFT